MKTYKDRLNELYKEMFNEKLNIIEKNVINKEELTFLYQIEEEINKFGLVGNLGIKQIRSLLNQKHNLAILFECQEQNVAINEMDFKNNEIHVCININLDTIDSDKIRNLMCVLGDIYSTKESVNLSNLKIVGGTANLENLKDASKLSNLIVIGGRANFYSLENSLGLGNLKIIGSNAHFQSLRSASGLYNLKIIGGNAQFGSLKCAAGLDNLKNIGGYAQFNNLTDAADLNGLESIGNFADFSNLRSASGLSSLKIIGGTAFFESLESLNGLNKELVINGDAFFGNKINIDDIINYGITIRGNVYIDDVLVTKEEPKIKTLSKKL